MTEEDTRAGLLFSVAAFTLWGVMPLYWRLLGGVPAIEITVHRILWCAVTLAILVAVRGRFAGFSGAMRNPRLLGTLLVSGLLISFNWGVNVWAVETGQLVEASLGYYINPLVSIALGVVLLGEKLSPVRWVAVALAVVAVVVQTAVLGRFPAIAMGLAVTFGFYGYLRKTANIGALDGVLVEVVLLFPFVLGFVLYWAAAGTGTFGGNNLYTDFLLFLSGGVTALPLVLFSAGARRVRLTTIGFLQYLAPSITLGIATLLFGEPFTTLHAVTFGCVWTALALLALEHAPARFRLTRGARQKDGSLPPASPQPRSVSPLPAGQILPPQSDL